MTDRIDYVVILNEMQNESARKRGDGGDGGGVVEVVVVVVRVVMARRYRCIRFVGIILSFVLPRLRPSSNTGGTEEEEENSFTAGTLCMSPMEEDPGSRYSIKGLPGRLIWVYVFDHARTDSQKTGPARVNGLFRVKYDGMCTMGGRKGTRACSLTVKRWIKHGGSEGGGGRRRGTGARL